MNGHEYGSSALAEIGFHDLERIEVLKVLRELSLVEMLFKVL